MYFFLILSLFTIIAFTLAINELIQLVPLGLGQITLEQIFELIKESSIENKIYILGIVLWGLFQLYGIPLIVFLVSYIGIKLD
jgi:hypothetical protein